ncbi:MAG: acyloxyacyl hydrolase [Bacteroidales bacterium]|nr:acyloxyacyl hydrolase [Bacteroidales bacterium]
MKRKLLSAIFAAVLCSMFSLQAQTLDKEHLSIGARGRWNHAMDAHGLYENLLSSYDYGTAGATVGLQTKPEDGDWFARAFNYPSFGLGLDYARMGSLQFKGISRLGDLTDLYGWAHFDLLRTRRFRVGPTLKLGLTWSPVAFDAVSNPENKFFGGHLFALMAAGLRAEWLIAPQWAAELSFDGIHHSNGMTKAPNWGINELALGLGVRYYLAPAIFPTGTRPAASVPEYRKGLRWNVFAAAGVHSCPVELDAQLAQGQTSGLAPARPRVVLGAELMWRYSPVFATGVLLDAGYTANRYRETDLMLEGREDPRGYSPWHVGIGLSQEVWYRQVSIHLAVGAYLFHKTGLTEDIGEASRNWASATISARVCSWGWICGPTM